MSDKKEFDRLFLDALATVKKMSPKQAGERLYAHKVSPFNQTRYKSLKEIPKHRQYFDDPHEWHGHGPKRPDLSSGKYVGDRLSRLHKIDPLTILRLPVRAPVKAKKRSVPGYSLSTDVSEEMHIKKSILRARRKGKI